MAGQVGTDTPLAVEHPHWVYLGWPLVLTPLAAAAAVAALTQLPSAPAALAWGLLALVVVPACWLVVRWVRWRTTTLVVTPDGLEQRRGTLRRDVVRVRWARVAAVYRSQTLLGHLVGSGRLVIELRDEPGALYVDHVPHPRALLRLIDEQLDAGAPAAGPEGTLPFGPPEGPVPGAGAPAGDPGATPPQGVPAVGPAGGPAPAPSLEFHRRLVELDDLRRRGILTEQEFEATKAEVLRRL